MNIRLLFLLILINTSLFAQLHTYNWANGNKKAEGVIKEGLEQGKWTFWSKEGTIQQEVNYKDGEFNGQYINYNEKGKKIEEGFFIKYGIKDDTTKRYFAGCAFVQGAAPGTT